MVKYMDYNTMIKNHNDGISNRATAKELGCDHRTVGKYIREYKKNFKLLQTDPENKQYQAKTYVIPAYDSSSRTTRKYTKEIDQFVDVILAGEVEKAKTLGKHKQKLTAVQIHEFVIEAGYTIGLSTLNKNVRHKLKQHTEVFIRQLYTPGSRTEFDFGKVKLEIAGNVVTVSLAVFCAAHSNTRFGRLYRSENKAVVIDAHNKYFAHAGGCFDEVVYDNMRTVVKKFIGRNNKELTYEIQMLAQHYNFKINVTNPRSGNEKGSVEKSVDFVRNKAFATKYQFDSLEEAQKHLECVLQGLNNQQTQQEEYAALHPILGTYHYYESSINSINKYGHIQIDNHQYSVPETLAGKTVEVRLYCNEVVIVYKHEIVAQHTRSFVVGGYTLSINHYLSTLKRKPGAIARSHVLIGIPELKQVFDLYYSESPRLFIEYLELHKEKPMEQIVSNMRLQGTKFKQSHKHISENTTMQHARDTMQRYNDMFQLGGAK